MRTYFIVEREGEREREQKERGGGREKEGESETEKEGGERDVEYLLNCFFKGMTGALAPFSYLVFIMFKTSKLSFGKMTV